jgi:dTDP-glucose pyrophosphorylase
MTVARTALVLAAGRGTRMQHDDPAARLDPAQVRVAARGLKCMIPDARGRPFIDHVLTTLASAGIESVGLVVPADHATIAAHLEAHPPRRLAVHLLVQPAPTGTAHAILAAEAWTAGRDFLSLNADNLYDPTLLAELAELPGAGCAAFDADALVRASNFPAERVQAFALLQIRPDGFLSRIVEKPDAAQLAGLGGAPLVSMNVWRFGPPIFDACRAVPRSVRGEFELPEAVALAIASGMPVHAVRTATAVLDLSSRGDVHTVAQRLAMRTVDR